MGKNLARKYEENCKPGDLEENMSRVLVQTSHSDVG